MEQARLIEFGIAGERDGFGEEAGRFALYSAPRAAVAKRRNACSAASVV